MTTIEWTDRTWNPTTGCDRVSPGCDNCYALTLANRLKAMGNPRYQRDGQPPTSGPGFGVTVHADKANDPLRWRTPSKVFVNSMSDLFHAHVPDEWIIELFAVMVVAQRHTFQILTKRPKRMRDLLSRPDFEARVVDRVWGKMVGAVGLTWEWPAPNIWLGTSVEDQQRADQRIPFLLQIPAAVRFLSCEPLLGPIDLRPIMYEVPCPLHRGGTCRICFPRGTIQRAARDRLDWVIVGGESGPKHRPVDPAWVRDLRDHTIGVGGAFFVKQDSGPRPGKQGRLPDDLWAYKEFPKERAA